MVSVPDLIEFINIGLCAIIAVLGYLGYSKSRDKVLLSIFLAFAVFGISHIITILDLAQALQPFLLIIRGAAYMMIIVALYYGRR